MEKFKSKKVTYAIIIIVACILTFVGSAFISRALVNKFFDDDTSYSAKGKIAEQNKTIEEKRKETEEIIEKIQSEDTKPEEKQEAIKKVTEKLSDESTTEQYKKYDKLSDEEKADVTVVPRKYDVDVEEFDVIQEYQDEHLTEESKTLPTRYSLRDLIELKVESQGAKGLCWNYAALNSIETHLYLTTGKLYDFSEHYVDYITSDEAHAGFYRNLADGGDFEMVERLLFEQQNIVEEKNLKECEYTEQLFHGLAEMEGEKIIITKTAVFPNFSKDNVSEEKFEKYHNIIKTHIINYGSVWCGMTTSNNTYIYREPDDISYAQSGHAVSIIGWDDSIPKEKFMTLNGNMPKNDGGYIIFNSWGEFYGENGYGYISYEDCEAFDNLYGVMSINNMDDMLKLSDIKNKSIRKAIKEQNSDAIITIDNVEYCIANNVRSLDLSNTEISDISDLKYFTNLFYLEMDNTNVSNIDVLKDLKMLGLLRLNNTKVRDVSCLKDCKNLEMVYLNNNPGLKGYESLTTVTNLELRNCGIKNFKNMSNELMSLDLSENPIEMLDISLEREYEYFVLKLNNCNITDITKLNLKNQKISELSIGNNPNISNINEITKLSNKYIYCLDLGGCNLKDISFLKEFEQIDILNLSDNKNLCGDLKGVKISSIILDNCGITSNFNFFNLKNVRYVSLCDNDIEIESLMDSIEKIAGSDVLTIEVSIENAETYSRDNLNFYTVHEHDVEHSEVPFEKTGETQIKSIEVKSLDNNTYIYPREVIYCDNLEYARREGVDVDSIMNYGGTKINNKDDNMHTNYKILSSQVDCIEHSRLNTNYEIEDIKMTVSVNPNLKPKKLYVTPMRNVFNSVDDVKLDDSFVQLGYGNGVYETITDYEIIPKKKYKKGVNTVTFKKDDLEFAVMIFIESDKDSKTENNTDSDSSIFTVKFKDNSTLIYDIAESMKNVVYTRDFEKNELTITTKMIYEPWNIEIRPESISELGTLSDYQIATITIKYEGDFDHEDYEIQKIGEEEFKYLKTVTNLQEIRIVTTDIRKGIDFYIDEEVVNKILDRYTFRFDVENEVLTVTFNYESDLYKKCIEAIPAQWINYGPDFFGGYLITIDWSGMKQCLGNEPDVSLELSGLIELRNLPNEFPIKELTLHLEDMGDEWSNSNALSELKNVKTLRKLILVDSNENRQISDYFSDEVIQQLSNNIEIIYEYKAE